MQKFEPFMKFLFQRYASHYSQPKRIDNILFDDMKHVLQQVSSLEVQKMLREMDYMKHIRKEVYNKLMLHINLHVANKTIVNYNQA